MIKLRPSQVDALRRAMTQALPDALLADYRQQGLEASRDPSTGDLLVPDKRGKVSRLSFTSEGLPARLVRPSGASFAYEHDPAGKLTAVENPGGQRIEFSYDGEGKPTEVRRPGLCAYNFSYDGEHQGCRVRHPDGSAQSFQFDRRGNILRTTDRNEHTTEYKRDPKGRLRAIVDPLGRRTSFNLDASGSLRSVRFADGSAEHYGYDPDVNVAVLTRRDGSDVFHLLTEEGSLAGAIWPESEVAFELDAAGNPAVVSSNSSMIEFDCNENGDTVSETSEAAEVEFQYDPDGRPAAIASAAGTVAYDYDDDGNLASIRDWSGNIHEIQCGPHGEILSIRYGNGLVERRETATIGLFEAATVTGRNGAVVSHQTYRWNVCERLTCWEDHPTAATAHRTGARLAYDREGHLVEERDPDSDRAVARYAYDAAGNLVEDCGTAVSYGDLDQPVEYGGQEIRYDALGQIQQLPGISGPVDCAFTDNGLLAGARIDGRNCTYGYDSLGRRILKTDGVHTWRFAWAGVQLLWEEYDGPSAPRPVRRDYLFLPDGIVPFAFREGGRIYTMQTDVRGAVIRVFDDAGNVVWHAVYDSFGAANILLERIRQPLRLAGHYYDEETGLHYNTARYYSPLIKSYLSRDPQWHEPEATNYSYARNDPWNRVDPHGTIAPLVAVGLLAAGAAIGAAIGFGMAKLTGSDPVAATIGGAVGGLGTMFGPIGGAISGFAGGVTESLIRQYRAGGPVSILCAVGDGVVGSIAGAALGGIFSLVGRMIIRPIVAPIARKLGSAIANKVGPLARRATGWAKARLANIKQKVGRARKRLLERRAKKLAKQLEKFDNGHSLARHGPDVTDSALQARLTTGIAPDGKLSPAPASTRFASHDDWVKTRASALEAFAKREGLDLSQPPPPNSPSKYPSIEVDHGRAIGDGFVGDGVKTKIPNPINPSKKPIKVFPGTKKVNNISKTRTAIEWVPDPSKPNAGSWQVKQHFPLP
jgi:RHS repeat-associated protein